MKEEEEDGNHHQGSSILKPSSGVSEKRGSSRVKCSIKPQLAKYLEPLLLAVS